MVSVLLLFQGLPGQNQVHQLVDQLINLLNQLMTMLETMQIFFFFFLSRVQKRYYPCSWMDGWMFTQEFGLSKIFFFFVEEINTFMQGHTKVTAKTFIIYITYDFHFIHLFFILGRKKGSSNFKQHNCFQTLMIIWNVSWAVNQHVRMISEGSCDTGDGNNDAEKSALHHRNKLYFKMY